MAKPQVAHITCSQCNGLYASERELCDHIQAAHRRSFSEQITLQHGDTQPDSSKNRLGPSKEEWAKLSIKLKNRVQARFNSEELDAIDCFILLARQGSVFDD
jgi:hypothetical protein